MYVGSLWPLYILHYDVFTYMVSANPRSLKPQVGVQHGITPVAITAC